MGGVKRKYEDIHKIIDDIEYKLCSECNDWHPLNEDYFYKNKKSTDGFNPYCKEATKKRSSKWINDNRSRYREHMKKQNIKRKNIKKQHKKENLETYQEKQLEWQRNNKDKVKEYNSNRKLHKDHDISDNEWEDCKNYFNYRCAYCDLPIEEHYIIFKGETKLGDFHKEHVDHEGSNDLSNCIPACKTCNTSKHDKPLEEWYKPDYELLNVYSYERLQKINKWINEDYKKYIVK